MPINTIKINKHKHKKSPWITLANIKSIKKRDKLYRDLKTTSSESLMYNAKKINLKTYNNILRKSIKLAKKMYFFNEFEKNKHNIKNTWKVIKDVIDCTGSTGPTELKIDNRITKDLTEITNTLNNYFVTTAKTITNDIKQPQNKSIHDCLKNVGPCSFDVSLITEDMTKKAIVDLKNKSSSGIDGIPSHILKHIRDQI